jgi:two-component system, OmpR family, sensor histidine kinase BaeS
VTVVGLDGQPLLRRPAPKAGVPVIDRPIRVGGEVVALARLTVVARSLMRWSRVFLRNQYLGILGVAATLMLLALASAWWFARRWAQPLVAVQHATARIARGETDVRLMGREQGQGRSDEIGDLVHNVSWVADISHELRRPLAVLRGEIEALVDGVRPLKHPAMLSLQEEVLRIGALVDDLHLLALSDLKALPCQFAELNALPFVLSLAQRFDSRAHAVSLTQTTLLVDAPAQAVVWDSTRIAQLLGNLLENCLRYTDAPGLDSHIKKLRRKIEAVEPGCDCIASLWCVA